MPRFNRKVKFTQEWKDAILDTIKIRKEIHQRQPSVWNCATCQLIKSQNNGFLNCSKCPIGQTEEDKRTNQWGWCPTYAINMETNKSFRKDEKARLTYLDKMERAVNRRKVVE